MLHNIAEAEEDELWDLMVKLDPKKEDYSEDAQTPMRICKTCNEFEPVCSGEGVCNNPDYHYPSRPAAPAAHVKQASVDTHALLYYRLHPDALSPEKAHGDDAGFDLGTVEDMTLEPKQ